MSATTLPRVDDHRPVSVTVPISAQANPTCRKSLHFRFPPLLHDDQHPLLRFAQHDFVSASCWLRVEGPSPIRSQSLSRRAPLSHTSSRSTPPRPCPGCPPHVRREQLKACLHHELLHERITHLHRAAFARRIPPSNPARQTPRLRARHGGRRADVNRIANALRRAAGNLFVTKHPRQNAFTSGLPSVRFVEINLARDGGNAEAISVMRNAGDDSAEEPAHFRRTQLAETQRVQRAHRSRTHSKNVPDNSAHPGRRPLERLHRARMIVRFDLEAIAAITDVDDAGVLLPCPTRMRATSSGNP